MSSSTLNRLSRLLGLLPGEGLFSHSIGGTYGRNKPSYDDMLQTLASIMGNKWKGKILPPAALIAKGKTFKPEITSIKREVVRGKPRQLPKGSILGKDDRVTSPFINQKGVYRNLTAKDLERMFNSKMYHWESAAFPKIKGKTSQAPWTISLEDSPGGLYGPVGFAVNDRNIKGRVRISAKEVINPMQSNNNEYRIMPDINPDGTWTTGTAVGTPFFLVGNEDPGPEAREFIRKLKRMIPNIQAVKQNDFRILNKKLPKEDVRRFWTRRKSGQQFDYDAAEKMVNDIYKSEGEQIKNSDLYKILLSMLR